MSGRPKSGAISAPGLDIPELSPRFNLCRIHTSRRSAPPFDDPHGVSVALWCVAGTVPRPWLAGQLPRQTEPKAVNKRLIGSCLGVRAGAIVGHRHAPFCGGFPGDVRSGLFAYRKRRPVLRALGLSPPEPLIVPVKADEASEPRIAWGSDR